jgi:hypothetical protein
LLKAHYRASKKDKIRYLSAIYKLPNWDKMRVMATGGFDANTKLARYSIDGYRTLH